MAHKLRQVRKALGLTIKELSELSGIATGTIGLIEREASEYKTRFEVAVLLSHALYIDVYDIFEPSELSHLGRPPCTGVSITVTVVEVKMCSTHFVTLATNGTCAFCQS